MSENNQFRQGYDPRVYGTQSYAPGIGTMPPPPVKRKDPNAWKIWVAVICGIALIASTIVGALVGRTLARHTNTPKELFTLQYTNDHTNDYVHSLQSSVYGSIGDLAEDVGRSVVSIQINKTTANVFLETNEETLGSGIIIGEDALSIYIATNYHVIEKATSIGILMGDESSPVTAYIKGVDTDTDLTVLYVLKEDVSEKTARDLKIAVFGDSDQCRLGDLAIAIGSAYDIRFGNSVTAGTISGLERSVTFVDPITNVGQTMVFLQTDAAINPGNSGGALVNGRGEVIGINNYKIEDTEVEGMGFATPSNVAKPVLEDLINYGRVSRPYIGVTGIDVTSYENYAVQYDISGGVLVLTLVKDGPSEKAGLLAYDVIIGIDDIEVQSFDDLSGAINSHAIGDTITVTVIRGYREGERKTVSFDLTIGEKDSTSR